MTSQKKCDCPFNVANCICQPEKDHGLQASAVKQRIDEQAKPAPPAVCEFAVQELDRLRARLAKYEDAEGRPVVTGDHPGLISALREMSNHVFNREHRLIVAAADALEYQAREIEVLEYSSRHNYECVQTLIDEKAALKANPGGVVLPERMTWDGLRATACNIRGAGWNACLDEVARLNSPPVSAGDDRKLSDIGNELHNLSCHVVHHNEGWANQLGTLASELWNWQARAALTASAPNHSEQVREWVPVSERLPDEHKAEYLCLFDAGHQQVTEWLHDETEGWCFWYGDPTHWMPLPAAPSAGSQGGDV